MTLTGGLNIIGLPWGSSSSSCLKEKKRAAKKGQPKIYKNKTDSSEKVLDLQDEMALTEMILAMQNRFFRW